MTQSRSVSNQAWVLLFALGLIWGGSFLAIRTALDEIPPLTSVFHRCFWAALALWAYVGARRIAIPRQLRVWGAFLVMGCLNNVIPFSLMAWGQLHVEVGLTSIYNATTAIFGVLVAAVFIADERLSARKLAGVATGFAGVAIAIGPEAFLSFDARSLAQLAIIAGTLSYAFAGAWARLHLNHLSPALSAAGMLTGSTVVMVPLMLALDGPPSLALGPVTLAAIAYYALAATALAYLLYYRILQLAGSGNLLLVTLLIPPVSIALGALVRGESLSPNAYVGFAVLSLGLVMLDGRIVTAIRNRI